MSPAGYPPWFASVLLGAFWLCAQVVLADGIPPPNPKTAREALSDPNEVFNWKNPKGFEKDVFTFVRLRYEVGGRTGRYNPHRWSIDYPDADLNLSFRIQHHHKSTLALTCYSSYNVCIIT